jgi:hypothetical protein
MRLRKTEIGQAAFDARSALLSPGQRRAFILADGKKTVADILATLASLGLQQEDLDTMLANGFLDMVEAKASLPSSPIQTKVPSKMTEKERYLLAKPLATKLTASLGIMGFRLNLAVESASGTEDLLALFPKIQAAVGVQECKELERLLKG